MNVRWLIRGGVLLIVAVVAVLLITAPDDEEPVGAEGTPPHPVTAEELRDAAADSELPIYWAGPMPGSRIELTQGGDGSALVTYLDREPQERDAVGSPVIGTYPMEDPAAAVAKTGAQDGATVMEAPGGTTVVSSADSPTSVYFADPENTVRVEVYDPSPQRAMSLARSGQMQPVEPAE